MLGRLAILVTIVAGCAGSLGQPAFAQTTDPATAAVKRLTAAGFWVMPQVPLSDWYGGGEPTPSKAYTVYADERSSHAFQFTLIVYPTAESAAAAYKWYSSYFAVKGTQGAYKLTRDGRLLYLGETGSISGEMHQKTPPTLPLKDFHVLLAISKGAAI